MSNGPSANRPPIAQPAAKPAPINSVPTRMATLTSVETLSQLIGFAGARYDFRDWVDRHNERYPLPPVGITGRPEWTKG